jgi:hypothetical protein
MMVKKKRSYMSDVSSSDSNDSTSSGDYESSKLEVKRKELKKELMRVKQMLDKYILLKTKVHGSIPKDGLEDCDEHLASIIDVKLGQLDLELSADKQARREKRLGIDRSIGLKLDELNNNEAERVDNKDADSKTTATIDPGDDTEIDVLAEAMVDLESIGKGKFI